MSYIAALFELQNLKGDKPTGEGLFTLPTGEGLFTLTRIPKNTVIAD